VTRLISWARPACWTAALAVAALSPGCLAGGDEGRAAAPIQPADAFPNVLNAQAAGDDRNLWIATTGRIERTGPISARVFRYAFGGGWVPSPDPVQPVDDGPPFSLALHDGVPCVGYTSQDRPTVSCLRGDGWTEPAPALGPLAGRSLDRLVAAHGDLFVLATRRTGRLADHRVLRLAGHEWRPVGQPVRSRMGIAWPSAAPRGGLDLAVAETVSGRMRRTVYSLSGDRWRKRGRALSGLALGPVTSGAVHIGARTFLPVVEARRDEWPFSVYASDGGSWRRARSGPLNIGHGSAQGNINEVGGRVWAIWQQSAFRDDGRFDTTLFAGRVDTTTLRVVRPRRLWRGVSIGPGDVQVVGARGRTWALFLRAHDRTPDGLQAEVTPIEGSAGR
jgi:hypothetical protein